MRSDFIFKFEVGQIFVVFSVVGCLLVLLQVGAILLFGGSGLRFVGSFDGDRKYLPLFADAFCDLGEREALCFEVFAYFCRR